MIAPHIQAENKTFLLCVVCGSHSAKKIGGVLNIDDHVVMLHCAVSQICEKLLKCPRSLGFKVIIFIFIKRKKLIQLNYIAIYFYTEKYLFKYI